MLTICQVCLTEHKSFNQKIGKWNTLKRKNNHWIMVLVQMFFNQDLTG